MQHKFPVRPIADSKTYGLGTSLLKVNVGERKSRNARRVIYQGRVFLLGNCGLGKRELAFLQDISTAGCAVISESFLQVGMELALSLVASWSERDVTVEMAKVRWTDGNRFGLEFLAIDPVERERLRLFLETLVGLRAPNPRRV